MKKSAEQYLRPDGTFVIEDFSRKKPFSNFFPGIAGEWGIPMWVFTTNRGQGIASFGIESKDKAILEFQPANKAYRLTGTQGFRTFLKVKKGASVRFYEPFRASDQYNTRQSMMITSHDLTIEEVNTTLGLSVTVNYFTMPEESFAGLVRTVTFRNISKDVLAVDMIDGLPLIIPFGQNDWVMKNMCRTIEAWYKVRNLDKDAPYFQLNVEPADVPQVQHVKEGNFYFAFDPQAKPCVLLKPVVDAAAVFGQATDFAVPERFMDAKKFTVPSIQQTDNRTPCAMAHAVFSLRAGASREIVSLTGFARSVGELNVNVKKATASGFIALKRERNRAIVEGIKSLAFTHSADHAFNAYAGQTFLDNVLRGGLPVSLKTSTGPAVFNVYSRKHGDMERDYNFFKLASTFLSQGNGNYRDVNQNRRNDVWFNPDLKDSALVNFFSLTRADGYNPLVVCGMAFTPESGVLVDDLMSACVKSGDTAAFAAFLKKGFMPGDVFTFIADNGIRLKVEPREFLARALSVCRKSETAQHGEGFWTDHWTYNLDLVESYLALYPENLRDLLLNNRSFSFYHNEIYVQPREKRYVLTTRGVRQYHSLHEPGEVKDGSLRVHEGRGDVYRTTFLVKMLCLIANKAATLDPSGIGIEMEGNKPNWYDSLNGLPGLLGSSISETFELRRFAAFILDAFDHIAVESSVLVPVFEELADFCNGLGELLTQEPSDLDYWDSSNTFKETYRSRIRHGISGVEKELSISAIRRLLEGVIGKTNKGVARALQADGLFATYYIHKVTRHEVVEGLAPAKEGPHVKPLAFERYDLPLFLEGFVHALRSEKSVAHARALHKKVRKSQLFDREIGMYKLNINITAESEEIGRTRVFPRGWLENESIWLHMEYKYLLELLRQGLYDEFYQDLATCCIPFMDPDRYGRSILENSSFIVSSAHPDKDLHGQGFVARLSGSTAEFTHMWMMMNAGAAPFKLNADGVIELDFKPALKGTWFTEKKSSAEVFTLTGERQVVDFPANTYAFHFMGRTLVVYHNSRRADTFGARAAVVARVTLTYAAAHGGKVQKIAGACIASPFAGDVRDGKVMRMDVILE